MKSVKFYQKGVQNIPELFLNQGAVFSPCRTWRYTLWRIWDPTRAPAAFIGLNPSTADEIKNDPTVTRCQKYAHSWGYGGLIMLNIFAYRATDPRVMKAALDPVGPDNDFWLLTEAARAGIVVAAWGTHGAYQDRGAKVKGMLPELFCLELTRGGHPKHPLYLKGNLRPRGYP